MRNYSMKKKLIRLTEGDIHRIVKESVNRVLRSALNETRLDYDEDNFSGRWNKNISDEDLNPEDYLDNPYNVPNSFDDDEWVDGDKGMENDYSWNAFDNKAISPGVENYYNVTKYGIPSDVDRAMSFRKDDKGWSNREIRNRDRMMNKWINGKSDAEDVGDSWGYIH